MILFVIPFAFEAGGRELGWRDYGGLAAMVALFGGLGIAWWRETWGGVISLLGWVGMSVLEGRPMVEVPFVAPVVVAGAFVYCGLSGERRGPMPGWLRMVCMGPLPVFVLLCGNEMLGNPPLMARAVSDPAGEWILTMGNEAPCEIRIAKDGAVTGCVAGRMSANRTWFGRMLNWRTDYRIRGERADGGRVSILVDQRGEKLKGYGVELRRKSAV